MIVTDCNLCLYFFTSLNHEFLAYLNEVESIGLSLVSLSVCLSVCPSVGQLTFQSVSQLVHVVSENTINQYSFLLCNHVLINLFINSYVC